MMRQDKIMTDREWFDTYARHMVDTELYAEARARLAVSMLNKMFRELKSIIASYGVIRSKREQAECERECNDCIRRYLSKWHDGEEKEREKLAGKESGWLSEAIKAALGITVLAALGKLARALEAPFCDYDNFDGMVRSVEDRIRKAVRTPLLSSRIFGTPTDSVAGSLDASLRKISVELDSGVRASVTALQRNVQQLLLEDKRRLRFVYVSMLDSSVCAVCAGYSGNVYEDLSKAPGIPVHFRCRCYYMPVLSSSMPEKAGDYQSWFDRQPDSVKYRILGPARYNFYKAGLTDIKRFTSDGRKLTLKELFDGKPDDSKVRNPVDGMWSTEKVTKSSSLHIAKERLEDGMKDPLVYGSDKMMAKTLARETGKDVWLLPERHKEKGTVNPDAFFDGKPLEMKHVYGERNKVGKNAVRALEQAKDVFLYVDKNFGINDCISKIKGSLFAREQDAKKQGDKPFVRPESGHNLYIFTQKTLYVFDWKDIF